MLLKDLTTVIESVINDIEPDDVRLSVGCLLYTYLENQTNRFDLRNKALSFKNFYLSDIMAKKYTNRTIGFVEIEKFILGKKAKKLDNLTRSDLDKILTSYKNIDLEARFNPYMFSSKLFGLSSFKDEKEKLAYKYLNDEILRPIADYCKNNYSSEYSNLKIVKVTDTIKPAREIFFYYQDIPTTNLITDLNNKKIIFKTPPTKVKLTRESYIHVIL